MAANPYFNQYPYLDHLLGAWFHQDFDLVGDVPEVVAEFVAVGPAEAVWAVVADIRRFLAYRSNDLDAAFQHIFKPGIDPAGWGMTAAEWLRWVDELLMAGLARR